MRKRLTHGSIPALLLLLGHTAQALPGTHPQAISTFDTRASSVVLSYRHGFSDAGPFNTFSYNANFTNTTGKLSAQFGLHYVNFTPKVNDEKAHGVAASGVALFVFPVSGRWEDGVPKAALSFYVGSVPTIYVSGERNYLTIPLTLGFGVPLSPHKAITFTPWFEIAPSANLDTIFKPADITASAGDVTITPDPTPDNPNNVKVTVNQSALENAVKKGVTADLSFKVPVRAGLEAGIHVGPSTDFNLYTSLGSLGGGFSGSSVFSFGAGVVFRWDDIVPAVLPVERRLDREGCDAIEGRFRSCPNSREWLSPEQKARLPQSSAPAPATVPVLAPEPSPGSATQKPAPLTPAPIHPTPPPSLAPTAPAPTAPTPAPAGQATPTPGPASAAFPTTN
ncbi:MAG: hypothetical protein ABUL62_25195 [Myxococcales bacterium]